MPDDIINTPISGVTVDEDIDATELPEEDRFEVSIATEGGELVPVHTKTYGMDSHGQSEQLTSDCGTTETRANGATGFHITLEGILTLEQVRKARQLELQKGQRATITLQPWTETYTIDSFSIDKPNDLNEWVSTKYPNGIQAFTYQLQTKNPEEQSP
jgi:hypothetical protein